VYADDIALFIKPLQRDALMIKLVLSIFLATTGLVINLSKSSAMHPVAEE
jgi:hypothetical protein